MTRSAAVLFLVLVSTSASAAEYWVKNGGSDALDGLSAGNAWATLQHAAGVVDAGDTVHVLDGSYVGFDLRRSGTTGNPITFAAESLAVQITADNGTTPDGINVENAAHVVIDGFTVDGRTRAGIRIAVSQDVAVRHCHTAYNGRWGIFSGFADDLTIEGNETDHSQAEHGIYVSNSGDRPIIRGNLVHDNHANGIHMNGDLSQGGDGLISNALVEDNVIYGNGAGGGSGINMDGVTDSVVRNNLLYDNHASGISLYRIDGATGSTNNLVVNNTVLSASDGRWCININNGSTGNTLRNNILYNDHSFRGVITIDSSSRTGFTSDDNSVMSRFSTDGGDTVIGLAAWQALGYDAHSFLAAPADLFIAPGSDFHLLLGCPAVDSGTAAGAPSVDLDGNPRPVGVGVDVGAYELQLPNCGDGNIDPGEQCGEPGLDCAPEQICAQCVCVQAPPCGSGISFAKPRLRMRSNPFSLALKGEAVIAKPWQAIDPLVNGVRVVVDSVAGGGGLDVTIPGGAGWKVNKAGTRWVYIDREGTHAGITRVVVRDRSTKEDGLLRWVVKGKGGVVSLPSPQNARASIILGSAAECASYTWNPPGAARPRCDGDSARLVCR